MLQIDNQKCQVKRRSNGDQTAYRVSPSDRDFTSSVRGDRVIIKESNRTDDEGGEIGNERGGGRVIGGEVEMRWAVEEEEEKEERREVEGGIGGERRKRER